jgi:FkbM family methyltransferase
MTLGRGRPDQSLAKRAVADEAIRRREHLREGRSGRLAQLGEFSVFVDEDRYAPEIRDAIDQGYYERRERELVRAFVRPDDRVLELGAGIGVVAMTAASIVGENHVISFDANPEILADARDNFKRNGFAEIETRSGLMRNRRAFERNSFAAFYIDAVYWTSRLDASATTPGIVKVVEAPVYCLEDEIAAARANVLLCDIEGGEIDLLTDADLSGIRLLILETHDWMVGETATDALVNKLIREGFAIRLGASGEHVFAFQR